MTGSDDLFPGEIKGEEEKLKMKKNEGVTRASILSQGLQRLIRRFKSFTQYFGKLT